MTEKKLLRQDTLFSINLWVGQKNFPNFTPKIGIFAKDFTETAKGLWKDYEFSKNWGFFGHNFKFYVIISQNWLIIVIDIDKIDE